MPTAKKITFKDLAEALLDEDRPFPARYLHHFSDLSSSDQTLLQKVWPKVSLVRRQALMEDLEQLGEADDLLSFEGVCRLALHDSDPLVRAGAVRILADCELVEFIPVFLDMAEHDEAAPVRASAALALGPFVYMGEVDLLNVNTQRNLEDKLLAIVRGTDEPEVRMRALESLGYTSNEEVIPLIEAAYQNGNPEWLAAALFAMGRSANSDWESKVLPLMDDNRPAIRSEAATAAGGLESKAALRKLFELLDDSDSQVRLACIWALSEIGGTGVRSALTNMLENTEDDEEAQLLEEALDNLSFTDGSGGFELLDVSEGDDEDDEDLLAFEDEELDVED
jgi:HEAT repeat protein